MPVPFHGFSSSQETQKCQHAMAPNIQQMHLSSLKVNTFQDPDLMQAKSQRSKTEQFPNLFFCHPLDPHNGQCH